MQLKRSFAAFCLIQGMLLFGCSNNKEVLRNQMKLRGDGSQSKDGLVVAAKVLDEAAITKDPRLSKTIDVVREGQVRQVSWMLVAPPVFEVRLTNKTGHIVRMTGAVFKLVDGAGNLYDALPKDKAIAHEMDAAEAAARQGLLVPPQSREQITQAIKQLRFLDENTQLLPDLADSFYLMFELPVEPTNEALNQWLGTQTTFQLKIFEVPTQVDQAGGVAKRVAFEFPLTVTTVKDTYEVGLLGAKLVSSDEVKK